MLTVQLGVVGLQRDDLLLVVSHLLGRLVVHAVLLLSIFLAYLDQQVFHFVHFRVELGVQLLQFFVLSLGLVVLVHLLSLLLMVSERVFIPGLQCLYLALCCCSLLYVGVLVILQLPDLLLESVCQLGVVLLRQTTGHIGCLHLLPIETHLLNQQAMLHPHLLLLLLQQCYLSALFLYHSFQYALLLLQLVYEVVMSHSLSLVLSGLLVQADYLLLLPGQTTLQTDLALFQETVPLVEFGHAGIEDSLLGLTLLLALLEEEVQVHLLLLVESDAVLLFYAGLLHLGHLSLVALSQTLESAGEGFYAAGLLGDLLLLLLHYGLLFFLLSGHGL